MLTKKEILHMYVAGLTDYTVRFYSIRGYGYRKMYDLLRRQLISKDEAKGYATQRHAKLRLLADILGRNLERDFLRFKETTLFEAMLEKSPTASHPYERGQNNFTYLRLLNKL